MNKNLFSSENGFRFVDSTLPYDSFSFISSAHSSTSWIDHCLISGNIDVANYEINYELAFYDHLSLFLTIKTIISYDANDDANDDLLYKLVDWNHFDVKEYCNIAEYHLMNIDICDKIGCTLDHYDKIDSNFDMILCALHAASENFTSIKRKKFTPVAGWNLYCRGKYSVARSIFIEWVKNDRPRVGDIYERMKSARNEFIDALNYCKRNRDRISNEVIADSYCDKNVK